MYDSLEENTRDKLYIWISERTNGEKYLVEGNSLFIYQRMGDRGGSFISKGRLTEGKNTLQRKRGRTFWWVM